MKKIKEKESNRKFFGGAPDPDYTIPCPPMAKKNKTDQKCELNRVEERLTDRAEVLNRYLSQYKHSIGKKKILEVRREEILREFESPLKALNVDGMPKGNGSGVGCAAISYRLDEIDIRIKEQMEKSIKILSDIMDVIDFLPENSLERAIIENRYIDRYSWGRVCRENHISRTSAIRKWKKGLYMLLEFNRVKMIISECEFSV